MLRGDSCVTNRYCISDLNDSVLIQLRGFTRREIFLLALAVDNLRRVVVEGGVNGWSLVMSAHSRQWLAQSFQRLPMPQELVAEVWVKGFMLIRRTQRRRLQAKLREVKTELKQRRHLPIPEQGQWLRSVVAGHFAYYAVPTNFPALRCFRT